MRSGAATLVKAMSMTTVTAMSIAITIGISGWVEAQELPTKPRDTTQGGCKGAFLAQTAKHDVMRLEFDLQQNPVPREVKNVDYAVDLENLSKAYVSGEWKKASTEAERLLTIVSKCPTVTFTVNDDSKKITGVDTIDPKVTPPFNLGQDYVHLLWVSKVPAAADPTVFSMLVHTPALPPYSRVLPGLSDNKPPRLFEVFLSENAEAGIASYYISKPLPDPLLEQVPQVVEKFLGPIFTAFDRINPDHQLAERDVRQGKPPVIGYTVRKVELPEPRSGIEVTMRATQPITVDQLNSELANLAIAMTSQGFVGKFTSAYKDVFNELAKLMMMGGTPPKACHEVGSAAECKRALHEAITKVFDKEREGFPADPARRDLDRFEAAMHAFVEGLKPTFVSGKATLDNSPLTHLSFGLLSSYALYVGGDDLRAKVENGKVVNAPLPRALQMVVLNMSFPGYQSKTIKRWLPEPVFQPFAGFVFSPDPGLAAGVSFRVLSNIGINAGYAYMFIPRPNDGLDFGAVLEEKIKDSAGKDTAEFRYPPDLRQDPFQSGHLHTLFIGASYNFK